MIVRVVCALTLGLTLLSGCATMSDPLTDSAEKAIDPADSLPEAKPLVAPEIQAFADRTLMTPLAREIFFNTNPQLQARAPFTSSCPAKERRQILGCYIDERIFILQVEQTDLAPVMDVTAAHEMLHAAYQDLGSAERKRVDGWTRQFYESTGSRNTDLRQMLERYPESERTNELHSLLGTQLTVLNPELERYYARYFVRRDAVVGAHDRSDEVFDDIESRHAGLVKEIQQLTARIDELVAQETAKTAEAQQLSAEIQRLRQADRIDDSNALVAQQNAAADRAAQLQETIRSLIEQHNGKVKEINQLVFRQDQLIQSLGAG